MTLESLNAEQKQLIEEERDKLREEFEKERQQWQKEKAELENKAVSLCFYVTDELGDFAIGFLKYMWRNHPITNKGEDQAQKFLEEYRESITGDVDIIARWHKERDKFAKDFLLWSMHRVWEGLSDEETERIEKLLERFKQEKK